MTRQPEVKARRTVVLERTFEATLEEVWELWTSKEGIEAWWGPEGFSVTVDLLDLRPGGELRYRMTAVAPEMAAFMQREGMPVTTANLNRFTEVAAPKRLAWTSLVDFVPGTAPYEVGTRMELSPAAGGVRLVLTLDVMHDDVWTQRASMGWEMELGKLQRLLASRR